MRITIKKDTRQDQMEPENKEGDIVAPQIPLPYPARKTTELEPVRGTAPLPPRTAMGNARTTLAKRHLSQSPHNTPDQR